MTKSICALVHRPDSDREAFQRYYEERHAPLGVRHFPFTRYVRNHLLDAPDIGFDTISEFWADDIAATAALMDGPVGEIMRADEERFMDRSRIAPGGSDEHVLSAGALADAHEERYAVLIRYGAEDSMDMRDKVLGWASEMAERTSGVSVDFVQSWQTPAFPADAVLWTPDLSGNVPDQLAQSQVVRVRRVEAPAHTLLGRAQAQ
ncbi:EthD domain-containing protein [Novosphingobium aquimarinum]|uniref:EthD domain-containing protein n=1 Tax=Novosphingobium aquimarinum TaxID=2682494 RepID=UPI0012EC61FE|nr:EthD domain-containing protein [Novosphingobium aquimarinum]